MVWILILRLCGAGDGALSASSRREAWPGLCRSWIGHVHGGVGKQWDSLGGSEPPQWALLPGFPWVSQWRAPAEGLAGGG